MISETEDHVSVSTGDQLVPMSAALLTAPDAMEHASVVSAQGEAEEMPCALLMSETEGWYTGVYTPAILTHVE